MDIVRANDAKFAFPVHAPSPGKDRSENP
jgi:hypothetical protein